MKEEEKPPDTDADKMLGVAEFEEQYFCGPLYLSDEDRTLYQHLGNQPIFTLGTLARALLNPFKARREMKEMGERMKARKIEGNMVGDGLVKGGVLCIAPSGEIKHTFYEDPGNGIPSEELAAIVSAAAAIEAESAVGA